MSLSLFFSLCAFVCYTSDRYGGDHHLVVKIFLSSKNSKKHFIENLGKTNLPPQQHSPVLSVCRLSLLLSSQHKYVDGWMISFVLMTKTGIESKLKKME